MTLTLETSHGLAMLSEFADSSENDLLFTVNAVFTALALDDNGSV